MRGLVILLLLASSAPSAWAQEQDPILIGIGDVPEAVQDCVLVDGRTADECDPEFQKLNEAIDSGLGQRARDGIDVLIPYNLSRSWLIQTGVHVGSRELTIDEVRSDPVRRAIEDARREQQATAGSWVSHTLEIRPRLGIGYKPPQGGPISINNLLLGFLPQFSIQVQVVRHYDLPPDFPSSPRDRVLLYKELFKKSIKSYLKLPSQLDGGSLQPGETVQLESYLSTTALPSLASEFLSMSVGHLLVGGFTRLGFEYFQTFRYRRYTIQKRLDAKIHVILETPDVKRWGPFADVGLSANFFFIDSSLSIANAGYRWLSEKNTVKEYMIDLQSEEARTALKKAYLWGEFDEVERLGIEDCSSPTGVRALGWTDAKTPGLGTHASGWRVKFLGLGAGNTHSTTDQLETPASCLGPEPSTYSHVDEVQKVRKGFRATRIFNLGIRTLNKPNDGDHSLWVKLNFSARTTRRDEMLQLLRVAKLVASPQDALTLLKIAAELETTQALRPGERLGRVHAYVSLEFDSTAISSVLSMSEDERQHLFRQTWSAFMGSDPTDTFSYRLHLRRLEKFLEAAHAGIGAPNEIAQAKAFLEGLERAGIDLYPFAAMLAALPDRDHVLATTQIFREGETRAKDILIGASHVGRLFNEDDVAKTVLLRSIR